MVARHIEIHPVSDSVPLMYAIVSACLHVRVCTNVYAQRHSLAEKETHVNAVGQDVKTTNVTTGIHKYI